MMAVIVSTADSFLLIPATNLTRDVYQRFINPEATERTVVFTSRLFILALGGIAYTLVNSFPTILKAAFTAYLIYGASITPSLIINFPVPVPGSRSDSFSSWVTSYCCSIFSCPTSTG